MTVVSRDPVSIATTDIDGGTICFVWVDSAYEFGLWDFKGPGREGRETTDSERPDTSFLLREKRLDPQAGGWAEWTERLDSAHSWFVAHGEFRAFYSGGVVREETGYILGRRHGSHRRWYENGQIEVEGSFVRGLRHGSFKYWNRDGSVAGEAMFDSGSGNMLLKDENGRTILFGQYCGECPRGIWQQWRPDGQLAREEDLGKGGITTRIYPPYELDPFEIPKQPCYRLH